MAGTKRLKDRILFCVGCQQVGKGPEFTESERGGLQGDGGLGPKPELQVRCEPTKSRTILSLKLRFSEVSETRLFGNRGLKFYVFRKKNYLFLKLTQKREVLFEKLYVFSIIALSNSNVLEKN